MKPRRLREFRIDDGLEESWSADSNDFAAYLPVEHAGEFRRFLRSQDHLRQIGAHAPADILLIDVNFDRDTTDPLASFGKRPLGLLYGLCFFVAGKVARRPFGYAFHTMDPRIWNAKDTHPAMQGLTIVLTSLCAALTSQKAGEQSVIEDLDGAIEWLSRRCDDDDKTLSSNSVRTPADGDEARLLAAERFRRSLQAMANPSNVATSHLVVDPSNHVRLLKICKDLGNLSDDEVVGEHELLQSLGVLVFIDGKPDCYSISGLFPNVVGGLLAQDFRTETTSRDHSAETGSWRYEMAMGKRPLVAEYLHSLGQWSEVYSEAKNAANQLGSGQLRAQVTLTKLIRAGRHSDLTRFLALAFGIVRLYQAAWMQWCNKWSKDCEIPWPAESREKTTGKPLRVWLDTLLIIIQELCVNDKGPDEASIAEGLIQEKWRDVWSNWSIKTESIVETERLMELLHVGYMQHCDSEYLTREYEKKKKNGPKKQRPTDKILALGQHIANAVDNEDAFKTLVGESIDGVKVSMHEIERKKELLARLLSKVIKDMGTDDAERRSAKERLQYALNPCLGQPSVLSDWLLEYLRLLQAIGYVEPRIGDDDVTTWCSIKSKDELPNGPPIQPREFRPEWLSSSGLLNSAGFSEYREIGRIEGPDGLDLSEGIIKAMVNGEESAPSWLIPLCVQYAHEPKVGFYDRNGWPEFMQVAEQ